MKPQSANSTAGFTLLEALLATALMAIILGALATVTAQWMPNWNRGIARMQRSEQLALGLERLINDIAAAQYIPFGREGSTVLFDGTSNSVTFVRTVLAPNEAYGLEIVRLAEVRNERGSMVVRTRAPFSPTTAGRMSQNFSTFSDPVVLLRPPYRLTLSYAGHDRAWHDTWRPGVQLPTAVRLTVLTAQQSPAVLTTATLIHSELPAECISAKSMSDCLESRRRSIAVRPPT